MLPVENGVNVCSVFNNKVCFSNIAILKFIIDKQNLYNLTTVERFDTNHVIYSNSFFLCYCNPSPNVLNAKQSARVCVFV